MVSTNDEASDGAMLPAAIPSAVAVVGIGASAGGLAAVQAFFSSVVEDKVQDAAFVLVQHLSPNYKSLLVELIGRITPLKVQEAEDGIAVEGGHLYIIPPNRDLALVDGRLEILQPQGTRGHRMPIDFFFRSLAEDQHERAICIVLSGTGSDGTLGLRAVKSAGGMAMAQLPESCEYDGMPRSAIASGLVDHVLPPGEMPAQINAYLQQSPAEKIDPEPSPSRWPEGAMKKIFAILRARVGHDFSKYKRKTVVRRLERRMAVNEVALLNDYVRFLQSNTTEGQALFEDLLIGVTGFFRDPEAYQELQQRAIPLLFADKEPGASIRVWVPGCSAGEEAYSIAILLEEQMAALKHSYKVQVFATDLDQAAIERARAGVFPESIAGEVSTERLARHFAPEQSSHELRVNKNIRSMVIFSEHDVLKDPPFSRLDLISCRNLLIYLETEAQAQLFRLFHYALRPGGFLFLGSSETAAGAADLFAGADRKSKLYVRKDDAPGVRVPMQHFVPRWAVAPTGSGPLPPGKGVGVSRASFRELTEEALLKNSGSAGVLVNKQGEIFYLHGRTGIYLEPAPGEAGMNILKMAREGLREALLIALHRASASGASVRQSGLRVKTNGDFTAVDLTVTPVAGGAADGLETLLVILDQSPATPGLTSVPAPSETDLESDPRIQALTQDLRTVTEELEAANEELRSSNEEMQSGNEELQAANEELETSKEELQSVNEELATVNAELRQNVKDLSRINNDMNNLLAGSEIGTIFVDHKLQILRFTPAITKVVNLIAADVGRPVGQIVSNLLGYDRLVEDVQGTLDTLVPKEVEVRSKVGNWYLLRIRPYRTLENIIEGAVITFTDVTVMKQSQDDLRLTDARRRVLFESMPQGAVFYDKAGRITDLNPAAAKILHLSRDETHAIISGALSWSTVLPDGADLPLGKHPVTVALGSKQAVQPTLLGIRVAGRAEPAWVQHDALPMFRLGDDSPFQVFATLVPGVRNSPVAVEPSATRHLSKGG